MNKSLLHLDIPRVINQKKGGKLWAYFLEKSSNLRLNVLFPLQLNVSVWFLNKIGNTEKCDVLFLKMANLPQATLGKKLYDIMSQNGVKLVPWYKEHDLKHALLGYKMTTLDEMRMQCFMWGNAGFSFFTTFVTFFFIIWTPEMWADIKYHYRAGGLVRKVSGYKIENCIERDLESLRKEIGLQKALDYFKDLNAEKDAKR